MQMSEWHELDCDAASHRLPLDEDCGFPSNSPDPAQLPPIAHGALSAASAALLPWTSWNSQPASGGLLLRDGAEVPRDHGSRSTAPRG
jgi:hypothetical protein